MCFFIRAPIKFVPYFYGNVMNKPDDMMKSLFLILKIYFDRFG
jgi:hypothetical protein